MAWSVRLGVWADIVNVHRTTLQGLELGQTFCSGLIGGLG